MSGFLERITVARRADARARAHELGELERLAARAPAPRDLAGALSRPGTSVIAEVKRASPSAGAINRGADPVAQASAYAAGGASAISVLTEPDHFGGSLADLRDVRAAVDLPVLRKDFIIDPYQVYEARAAGADAVLLIAECIPDDGRLIDLLILATELKLTTLVEVHDVEQLLRVRPHIGFPNPSYTLLGINNRNLKSMTTDLNHTLRLLGMVENTDILVSESGIRTHEDVKRLMAAGVRRVLVGEHLMRQADIGAALRALINGEAER